MDKTLVVMAAGMGSRYGGLKQIDPMGPNGETLLDYSVFDALRCGIRRIVFVIRRDIEAAFRGSVGARYEGMADVAYAFQEQDRLPAGFTVPPGRAKPWGTGQAVLAAEPEVRGPFAVANADDFYGPRSLEELSAFLDAPGGEHALVGFRLDRTLSRFGSVARGVCVTTPEGGLVSVREVTGLEATDDGGARAPDGAGGHEAFRGDELVSLNLWGFSPSLFPLLHETFVRFLERRGGDLRAEFYLPDAVSELVAARKASVRVLRTPDSWFGVTYRDDVPEVRARLRDLHAAGAYPGRLFAPAGPRG
jgi:hypothetical protein